MPRHGTTGEPAQSKQATTLNVLIIGFSLGYFLIGAFPSGLSSFGLAALGTSTFAPLGLLRLWPFLAEPFTLGRPTQYSNTYRSSSSLIWKTRWVFVSELFGLAGESRGVLGELHLVALGLLGSFRCSKGAA